MLWSLKPIIKTAIEWNPWKIAGHNHCTFGFIVRADSEQVARKSAYYSHEELTKVDAEGIKTKSEAKISWLDPEQTSCKQIDIDSEKKVTLSMVHK